MSTQILPQHLQERFDVIVDDLKELQEDFEQFKVSQIPTFYAVWRYLEDMGIEMSYDEAQDLAEKARNISLRRGIPVKSKMTFAGNLLCFHEDALDEAFEILTDEDY